jgi:hypothetical protein
MNKALGKPKKITEPENVTNESSAVIDDVTELRSELDSLGIYYTNDESLVSLAMKLSKEARRLNESKISSMADSEELKLRNYATRTNLTDKELIAKLYTAGVPEFYLGSFRDPKNPKSAPYYIFNDVDIILSTEELWEKVRFCGHSQTDFAQTMMQYAVQPKIKQPGQ